MAALDVAVADAQPVERREGAEELAHELTHHKIWHRPVALDELEQLATRHLWAKRRPAETGRARRRRWHAGGRRRRSAAPRRARTRSTTRQTSSGVLTTSRRPSTCRRCSSPRPWAAARSAATSLASISSASSSSSSDSRPMHLSAHALPPLISWPRQTWLNAPSPSIPDTLYRQARLLAVASTPIVWSTMYSSTPPSAIC